MRLRNHDLPSPLARGRDRFGAWRRTRKSGTRIPDRLWLLAVELAKSHGLNRTASILGLNYYALKKRVESANSTGRSGAGAFLELFPPPLSVSSECVIEFADGAGASMRVHLKGRDVPDLLALSRSFWSGE